jgi:hypothetical protein
MLGRAARPDKERDAVIFECFCALQVIYSLPFPYFLNGVLKLISAGESDCPAQLLLRDIQQSINSTDHFSVGHGSAG